MTTPPSSVAVHLHPAWRERADFLIAARIPDGGDLEFEQLWVRRAGDRRFEVCSIPFFLYDLALGDLVETDEGYELTRVVRASGRYVFRVWFGESGKEVRERTVGELEGLGALLEWRSENLLAVDARDLAHAQPIADLLAAAEGRGELAWETGRS